MDGGSFGKALEVNLTTGRLADLRIPDKTFELHLGGRGLAASLAWDHLRPRTDPLGPENALIIATGPLNGLQVPGAGRHITAGKSPATERYGEAYTGGWFGTELKETGYDALLIRGRADHSTYLTILDGAAELHDAAPLWGQPVAETEAWLTARHGKIRCSSIGPAGERLVRFASIISDRNRSAGRCGFGAMMGSKRLKSIAVRGSQKVPVADEPRYREALKVFTKKLMSDPEQDYFGKYGTAGGVEYLNEYGILPTRYWREGDFEGAKAISGETMAGTILKSRNNCTACPVRCKREVEADVPGEEERVTPDKGGPEYETVAAFGSLCGNADLRVIALANQLCNQYGLDTIATGSLVAFAMEASERGLIPDRIAWGDGRAIIETVRKIAFREGIGDLLAEGSMRAARELGPEAEAFACHVKGGEVPMHEPRGKVGLGLSYATSFRGATHLEGFHDSMAEADNAAPEFGFTEGISRFQLERKAPLVKTFEDVNSWCDSLIMCLFTFLPTGKFANWPEVNAVVGAVVGQRIEKEVMLEVGERNYNLCKLLTIREGWTRAEDRLPKRLLQALPKGGSGGRPIDEAAFSQAVGEYYASRGWDAEGRPTSALLARLSLPAVS